MTKPNYIEEELLKSSEAAILTKTPLRATICKRRKLGITGEQTWGTNQSKRPFPSQPRVKYECVEREVWNNKEWFVENYKKYGLRILSRIINRDMKTVVYHVRKYGLSYEQDSGRKYVVNPCNNKAWLEEHYVIMGKGLEKCAELANVNPYTIIYWLTNHGIPTRDRYESQYGERSSHYGKKRAKNGNTPKTSIAEIPKSTPEPSINQIS